MSTKEVKNYLRAVGFINNPGSIFYSRGHQTIAVLSGSVMYRSSPRGLFIEYPIDKLKKILAHKEFKLV